MLVLKYATKEMRYLARSKLSRNLVHKKVFCFMWHVVFKLEYVFCQGRIALWVWMNSVKVVSNNYSRWFCEQALVKLWLAFSFRSMIIARQTLKYAYVTYSFHKLLIFFSLTLSWSLIFTTSKKYCMYIRIQKNEIKTKKYIFSPVSDVDVEESCFSNA